MQQLYFKELQKNCLNLQSLSYIYFVFMNFWKVVCCSLDDDQITQQNIGKDNPNHKITNFLQSIKERLSQVDSQKNRLSRKGNSEEITNISSLREQKFSENQTNAAISLSEFCKCSKDLNLRDFNQIIEQIQNIPEIVQKKVQRINNLNVLNVKQWNIKQVIIFLQKINLKQYQTVFYKNKIKGRDLISLQKKQMVEDLQMNFDDVENLQKQLIILRGIINKDNHPKKQFTKQNRQTCSFNFRRLLLKKQKLHTNDLIIEEVPQKEQDQHLNQQNLMQSHKSYDYSK